MRRYLCLLLVAFVACGVSSSAQADTCAVGMPCKIAADVPSAVAEQVSAYKFYVDGINKALPFTTASMAGVWTVSFTSTFTLSDVGTHNVQISAIGPGGEAKGVADVVTVVAVPPTAPVNTRVIQ